MNIHDVFWKARTALGPAGIAGLVVLLAAALFHLVALRPLEARNDLLQQRLAGGGSAGGLAGGSQTAAKVAALYDFLETRESTTSLLAKVHGIGAASGVELRAGDYRMQKTGGRIERYEVTLPVTGTYAQIRTFLARALAEIPSLSLDQVSFRKQRANDAQVQAEIRLSLHLVRPR